MTISQTDSRALPPDAIHHINRLIEACIDSEKDYGLAAADIRNEQLKHLFLRHERERASFVTALQHAVNELGGFPENEGSTRGFVHRTWAGLVRTLTTRDERTILGQCMETEALALAAYDAVERTGVFRANTRGISLMLSRQRAMMQAAQADLRIRKAGHNLH